MQWEQLALLASGGVGARLPAPRHPWPHCPGMLAAPGRGLDQLQADSAFWPCSPSWAQLISSQHPSSQNRCCKGWAERGKRPMARCSLHYFIFKDFLRILKRQLISDLITWRTKYATFSYVTACYVGKHRQQQSHGQASSASAFFVCSPGFSCLAVTGSGKNFLWLIRF